MKITISSFAALVERDYGSRIYQAFLCRFPDAAAEIGFRDAMDALHGVLAQPGAPRPSFGATNSDPADCVLLIED